MILKVIPHPRDTFSPNLVPAGLINNVSNGKVHKSWILSCFANVRCFFFK